MPLQISTIFVIIFRYSDAWALSRDPYDNWLSTGMQSLPKTLLSQDRRILTKQPVANLISGHLPANIRCRWKIPGNEKDRVVSCVNTLDSGSFPGNCKKIRFDHAWQIWKENERALMQFRALLPRLQGYSSGGPLRCRTRTLSVSVFPSLSLWKNPNSFGKWNGSQIIFLLSAN